MNPHAFYQPKRLGQPTLRQLLIWNLVLVSVYVDMVLQRVPLSGVQMSGLQVLGLGVGFILATCVQPFLARLLIRRFAFGQALFNQVETVSILIAAAIAASIVSAIIGTAAVCWSGLSAWSEFSLIGLIWWSSSVLAHLMIAPPLLLWHKSAYQVLRHRPLEAALIWSVLLLICGLMFGAGYAGEYLLVPVLIWAVFRLGQFHTSLLVSGVGAIALIATGQGYGPFIQASDLESLLFLQSFVAVCSITTLILSAVIAERRIAQITMQQALDAFEQRVKEQQAQLQEKEALLDGFFAAAPVGLSIVDAQLRYVRVNELLAKMNGTSVQEHLGKKIRDILPDLAQRLEPFYRKVLTTGKPLLNQEVSQEVKSLAGIQRAWLISYFPIFDLDHVPTNVGVVVHEISDRKQIEIALEESEERYRSVVTALAEGIVLQDRNGAIHACNASAERILGLTFDQMIGRTSRDPGWHTVHEDGSPFPGDQHPAMVTLRTGQSCSNVVMGIHKPDGTLTWISINSQPLFRQGESLPYAVVASFADITDRKQADSELQRREEAFRALAENAPDIIMRLDRDCRYLYINPTIEHHLGIPPSAFIGKTPAEQGVSPELVQAWQTAVDQVFKTGETQIVEFEAPSLVGPKYYASRIVPEFGLNGSVQTVLAIARDVTDYKQVEAKLQRLATVDGLTQIANRRRFDEYFHQVWLRLRREKATLSLILVDVDDFKRYNDHYGHLAGDTCLQKIAHTLSGVIKRPTDLVARYGGEEFVIVLPSTDLQGAIYIAEQVQVEIQRLQLSHPLSQVSPRVTVSMGIASMIPTGDQSPEVLVALADKALYTAKAQGRNTYTYPRAQG